MERAEVVASLMENTSGVSQEILAIVRQPPLYVLHTACRATTQNRRCQGGGRTNCDRRQVDDVRRFAAWRIGFRMWGNKSCSMRQTGKRLRRTGLDFSRRTFPGYSRRGGGCELPVHAVIAD